MLSHEDLTEKESGGLTDAGFATISLRFAGIENYNKTIKNAQENLKELYKKHADGSDFLSEEEFLAKREEQLDIIRESTEAIADEKDAILDLVNNALELQIDSINELIEKKKKALATEKDLYEYQRKISKQTKNIALIQKQIAALSGDHSEEARAKVQKLQASLEEAQEDLKDTEYDRWHSDQEDMLDNLADEVEDFWERIMDDLKNNIGSSLDNILKMVTDNPDAVARALDELGLGDALSIITKYNPDGTHTNTAIDYGGNSYESTYDKDGDNVNNKFEEKYKEQTDGIHSDIKDLTDAADKLKDDAEKGTPWAEDAAQKAKEHAAATLLAQMKKKEDAILAADKRAEGILQQSAGGQKEFIVEDVPMEGVQGAVEKFLNSSALHKPTTEAGKKRMKADPLLKYIAENYNGKTLSNVNEARLGAYLGVPVKDINNVSKSEANKILKAFQGAGFANGGIASTLNKAAQENGDDGLITIQRGEAVLTKAQTEAVQDMADRFIHVGLPYTDEQLNMLRAHFNTPVDYSGMMPKYQNAPVNNANTSVNVGDVNIHMDGTGVVDKESFRKTLRDYDVRSDIEQIALGDLTKGSIRNSMRYI